MATQLKNYFPTYENSSPKVPYFSLEELDYHDSFNAVLIRSLGDINALRRFISPMKGDLDENEELRHFLFSSDEACYETYEFISDRLKEQKDQETLANDYKNLLLLMIRDSQRCQWLFDSGKFQDFLENDTSPVLLKKAAIAKLVASDEVPDEQYIRKKIGTKRRFQLKYKPEVVANIFAEAKDEDSLIKILYFFARAKDRLSALHVSGELNKILNNPQHFNNQLLKSVLFPASDKAIAKLTPQVILQLGGRILERNNVSLPWYLRLINWFKALFKSKATIVATDHPYPKKDVNSKPEIVAKPQEQEVVNPGQLGQLAVEEMQQLRATMAQELPVSKSILEKPVKDEPQTKDVLVSELDAELQQQPVKSAQLDQVALEETQQLRETKGQEPPVLEANVEKPAIDEPQAKDDLVSKLDAELQQSVKPAQSDQLSVVETLQLKETNAQKPVVKESKVAEPISEESQFKAGPAPIFAAAQQDVHQPEQAVAEELPNRAMTPNRLTVQESLQGINQVGADEDISRPSDTADQACESYYSSPASSFPANTISGSAISRRNEKFMLQGSRIKERWNRNGPYSPVAPSDVFQSPDKVIPFSPSSSVMRRVRKHNEEQQCISSPRTPRFFQVHLLTPQTPDVQLHPQTPQTPEAMVLHQPTPSTPEHLELHQQTPQTPEQLELHQQTPETPQPSSHNKLEMAQQLTQESLAIHPQTPQSPEPVELHQPTPSTPEHLELHQQTPQTPEELELYQQTPETPQPSSHNKLEMAQQLTQESLAIHPQTPQSPDPVELHQPTPGTPDQMPELHQATPQSPDCLTMSSHVLEQQSLELHKQTPQSPDFAPTLHQATPPQSFRLDGHPHQQELLSGATTPTPPSSPSPELHVSTPRSSVKKGISAQFFNQDIQQPSSREGFSASPSLASSDGSPTLSGSPRSNN